MILAKYTFHTTPDLRQRTQVMSDSTILANTKNRQASFLSVTTNLKELLHRTIISVGYITLCFVIISFLKYLSNENLIRAWEEHYANEDMTGNMHPVRSTSSVKPR